MSSEVTANHDRQWYVVGRWQEFEGESLAILLRIVAIGVFYSLQLAQYHLFAPQERDLRFHQAATALAILGVFASIAVLLCLRRRFFPAGLKFLSTTVDIVMVTGLAAVGSGPHSPLRLAFFLVIAMAALRFSLRLVWWSTLGTMIGYLALVGMADKTWFDSVHVVPPIEQLMTLACLALTGIVTGQVVRRVKSLSLEFCRRVT